MGSLMSNKIQTESEPGVTTGKSIIEPEKPASKIESETRELTGRVEETAEKIKSDPQETAENIKRKGSSNTAGKIERDQMT